MRYLAFFFLILLGFLTMKLFVPFIYFNTRGNIEKSQLLLIKIKKFQSVMSLLQ